MRQYAKFHAHKNEKKNYKSDYPKGVYQQSKYRDFIPNHIDRLGETESNIYDINPSPDDHLADRSVRKQLIYGILLTCT